MWRALARLFGVVVPLSFVWEMLQAPAFTGLPRPWVAHAAVCALAAIGDAVIVAVLFVLGSRLFGGPEWVWPPRAWRYLAAVTIGVVVQIIVEWVATEKLRVWGYHPDQPTIPVLGTGLWPVLYAVVVIPLAFTPLGAWRDQVRRARLPRVHE